jgi:hypothetical protein
MSGMLKQHPNQCTSLHVLHNDLYSSINAYWRHNIIAFMEKFLIAPAEKSQERDISPEIEVIIEEAREKRAGILNKIMSERAAKITEKIIHWTPIEVPALFVSAARGETLTGEKLDGKARLNYAAIAGFLTISYTLLAMGQHKEAIAAKGAAATFGAMEFGPELVKNTVAMAKEKMAEMAPFIEKTGEFSLHG